MKKRKIEIGVFVTILVGFATLATILCYQVIYCGLFICI